MEKGTGEDEKGLRGRWKIDEIEMKKGGAGDKKGRKV